MRQVYYYFAVAIVAVLSFFVWQTLSEGPADVVRDLERLGAETLASPDGHLELSFKLSGDGKPTYVLRRDGRVVVAPSTLGLVFEKSGALTSRLALQATTRDSVNESWDTVWGERAQVDNHYREMLVVLRESQKPHRTFRIRFRLFDDGLAFRYEVPRQHGFAREVRLKEERSTFVMPKDHQAWWIPADYDSYEHLYTHSLLSEIDATSKRDRKHPPVISIADPHAVNTPITMKTESGLFISIHEANLTDYAGMTLAIEADKRTLRSALVPSAKVTPVVAQTPFQSPWRTIQVAKDAGDLAESSLILNLNEPPKIHDTSWTKPGKYNGVWWGMHLGTQTWEAGKRHGATTERSIAHLDFAASHGLLGTLVEGWNIGWETWRDEGKPQSFDFITAYSDFDLEKVAAYAKSRSVSLIGHHETAGDVTNYERHMKRAMALYEQLGVSYLKTGYVGPILPKGEHHHGQWMVKHYRRVVELAAKHKINVIAHEPIKATGIRRTYPNMMTREGARGNEYNAPWADGNPPAHIATLPFTRCLAGPLDITPGIVGDDLKRLGHVRNVGVTVANQLAQYVVIYSPLHMLADLPENYEGHPALPFLEEVPTDWQESHFLLSEIGEHAVVARKERGGDAWYIGAVTNKKARELTIKLAFLKKGLRYQATLFVDGEGAHYDRNPEALLVKERELGQSDSLTLRLAQGGGAAVMLHPVVSR